MMDTAERSMPNNEANRANVIAMRYEVRTGRKRRIAIEARAKSDGLQLLRAINETQSHGQEGARVDPSRAVHEAGLDVGDVGSDRYHHALGYLLEEAALLGGEHTAFDVGDEHPTTTRSTSSLGGR
jgi:hypothetical protein